MSADTGEGGKVLETMVTFLEMTTPPPAQAVPKPKGAIAVLRASPIPVAFYRYLYHEVGHDWHWVDRKRLDDEALAEILSQRTIEIYVLYADGVPAGFAELDFQGLDPELAKANGGRIAELCYFGLTGDHIGRGLGRYFLHQTLDLLWAKGPDKVLVNTCTLDHPKALTLYQRAGFTPISRERRTIHLLD